MNSIHPYTEHVETLLEPIDYGLDAWEWLQLTSELEHDVVVAADLPGSRPAWDRAEV